MHGLLQLASLSLLRKLWVPAMHAKSPCIFDKMTAIFPKDSFDNTPWLLQSTTRNAPERLIVLHLVVYIYDEVAGTFRQLPDMPADLPRQVLQANAALHAMAAGQSPHSSLNASSLWVR